MGLLSRFRRKRNKKKSSLSFLQRQSPFHDELVQLHPQARQIVNELMRPIVNNEIQPVFDTRQHVKRIKLFEEVLELVDPQNAPKLYASLHNDFAISLLEAPIGDKSANTERAIEVCNRALKFINKTVSPELWSWIQNNMGIAFENRMRGNRSENLDRATEAYSASLEMSKEINSPTGIARAIQNLGCIYAQRVGNDRAKNLEKAIEMYNDALKIFDKTSHPYYWARIKNNLGYTLAKRVLGDRADNLEQAIDHCNSALEVCTKTDYPEKWADINRNLGFAFAHRILGDPADNLECAIDHYNSALQVYNKADYPERWANIQKYLGFAFIHRIKNDREDNLEKAIEHCNSAFEVYKKSNFPEEWALTRNILGNAFKERLKGDPHNNIEHSIEAFSSTLDVYQKDNYPIEWATANASLGVLYTERKKGTAVENRRNAITAYQNAIELFRELGLKDEERKSAGNLGYLHYTAKDWKSAYKAFETAISAMKTVRKEYFSEESEVHLAEECINLYTHMIDICLQLDRKQEALEFIEESKGSIFLSQLGQNELPTPILSSNEQNILKEENHLISKLRELESSIYDTVDVPHRRNVMLRKKEIRNALDNVWTKLEATIPEYISMRRGEYYKHSQIQNLVDNIGTETALVEFCTLPKEIIAFILRTKKNEYDVIRVPISQDKLAQYTEVYIKEVLEYRDNGAIGQQWQNLGKLLFNSILPYLKGVKLVYLIPYGILHFLPLHASRINGYYLIDQFPIVYAPSATVLGYMRQKSAIRTQNNLWQKALVLGYTEHDEQRSTFEGEAIEVAKLFGVEPYLGKNATAALLKKDGSNYPVIHLSCHGFVDFDKPMESYLQLADGKLTASDIMHLKLNADLVTVSACHTGIGDLHMGNEVMGLTRPILFAGASSVLVSLWSVSADSTYHLMFNFYNELLDKDGLQINSKAESLREAMRKIKNEKKWENPYYWSLFVLVGDWQ